jgi:hypothetical protein
LGGERGRRKEVPIRNLPSPKPRPCKLLILGTLFVKEGLGLVPRLKDPAWEVGVGERIDASLFIAGLSLSYTC